MCATEMFQCCEHFDTEAGNGHIVLNNIDLLNCLIKALGDMVGYCSLRKGNS